MARYLVAPEEVGARADRILASRLPEFSRRQIRELFLDGAVMIGDRPVSKSHLVARGDELRLVVSVEVGPPEEPEASLDLRWQSQEIVVVHKPAGQACAMRKIGERGTLVGAIAQRFPEVRRVGYSPWEPGLLHRLDTGTTGLVVVARSQRAFKKLRGALTRGDLLKEYLAVVEAEGLPERGTIIGDLRPHPRNRRRVRVETGDAGAERRTRYQVLLRRGRWALLGVEVKAAYRHQVRAHLAHLGHPLAGDTLYGGLRVPGLERHALHAARVTWSGDEDLGGFDVRADAPDDLRAFWER